MEHCSLRRSNLRSLQQAVADVVAAGIRFTAISSRPPRGMRWIIEELQIREPFAAFNGAAIVSPDWELLFATYIEPRIARTVIAAAVEAGASPWSTRMTMFMLPAGPPTWSTSPARCASGLPRGELRTSARPLIKVQAVSDDPAVIARCEALIDARAQGRVSATRSQTYYYDVTPAAATRVPRRPPLHAIGDSARRTTTIGDMENDIPMLIRAGFSIAMGQASTEVKSAAKAVTAAMPKRDSPGDVSVCSAGAARPSGACQIGVSFRMAAVEDSDGHAAYQGLSRQ